MSQSAAAAVLSILLALIVRAALEDVLKPIFEGNGPAHITPMIVWLQLAMLFVLTLRFYLGALRFVNAEQKHLSFFTRSTNFVFAFLLFCVFYALALSVSHTAYFYTVLVALHVIDAFWFIFALIFLARQTDISGEISVGASSKIAWTFLSLSLATIAYAFGSYKLLFREDFSDPNPDWAHYSFLGFLLLITILDFWLLREYYFDVEAWKARNRISMAS